MRILIVSETFYPRLAGAQMVIWKVANALTERGHTISVITSLDASVPTYEMVNGIEIFRPFSAVSAIDKKGPVTFEAMIQRIVFMARFSWYLRGFLKKRPVDVIYNVGYSIAIPTTWRASRNGIPVVGHIGQLTGRIWFQIANPVIATFNFISELFILHCAKYDAVRCASKDVSTKLQRRTNAKVHAIPSPIDTEEITRAIECTNASELRRELGVSEDEQFLLWVGSLVRVKNVDGLVRALSQSKANFKLFLIGEGPERNGLERLIAELSMENKVFFLGKKPHEEVLCIMVACDVLLLSSKSEVLPTVVLEALALEKPVIATNVGGVSEIKSANLHIVENVAQVNDILHKDLKPEPDDSVLKRYSLDMIVDEFENLFKSLVHRK